MDPITLFLLIAVTTLTGGSGAVALKRRRRRRRERMREALLQKFPCSDRYVSVFDIFWDLGASDFALQIMSAQGLLPRDPDDAERVFDTIEDRIQAHGSYSAFIADVLEAIQEFYQAHREAGHRRLLPTLEIRTQKLLPAPDGASSAPAPVDDGLPDGYLLDIDLDERTRSRESHAPGDQSLVPVGGNREVDIDELVRVDLGQLLRSALSGNFWKEAERMMQMRELRGLRGDLDRALGALWRRFDAGARAEPGFTDPLYDLTRRWEREALRIERVERERRWDGTPHELAGDLLVQEARILARLLAARAKTSTDEALTSMRQSAMRGDTAMAGYLVYLNHHALFVGRGGEQLDLVRDVEVAASKIRSELRALQRQRVM